MGVGVGSAHYVQTDIKRDCQHCHYARKAGFLCSESKMQENKVVATDKETGLKIVHPTMGCCDEWDPGKGVDLMQKPPADSMADLMKLAAQSRKKKA